MSGIKDSDNIEALRNRLYQRGTSGIGNVHHELKQEENKSVPTDWHVVPESESANEIPIAEIVPETYAPSLATLSMKGPKKRGYRLKLALLGVAFFGLAMVVSSFFLVFGRNSISGDNISLVLTIPFTIGGGEELPIQVGVRNDNSVPMESATLIIEYPLGTKSADDEKRDLFTERIPLETIKAGETLNMPLKIAVFGEENEEKIIKASIEYQVQGSGARFFKEADPQSFRISSAPISFKVDGVKSISSGQETSLTLTVVSNSLSPVSEVLVKAEYPVGFQFKRSTPETSDGNNTWMIPNVEPGSSHTITITGVIDGQDNDTYVMNFSAGIPNDRDKNTFASVFANAATEFAIEPSFIDIDVRLNSSPDRTVSVSRDLDVSGKINVRNTLTDSVYDMRAVATFSGNAFLDSGIRGSGFFESQADRMVWDVANMNRFSEIKPGDDITLSFDILPNSAILKNPFVDVKVDVFARRVSEANVAEELLGSVERTARVGGVTSLVSAVERKTQGLVDTGPVPPQVGETTTYTIALRIDNETNDIRATRVIGNLPIYVNWLNKTSGDGKFEYNQTNKQVTWTPGEVGANTDATATFQVSILPSVSQIGTTPVLFSRQTLQATDVFTGKPVQAVASERTTTLSAEAGFGEKNGEVVAEE